MTDHAITPGVDSDARAGGFSFAISWRVSLALLFACTLAFGVATMDRSPVGAGVDDAMYVILAKSLATGQGYRSLNLPDAPLNTHFPPGYPAALSVLWRIAPEFPGNLIMFRLFNLLCVAVVAVATARLAASRGAGRRWSFALGAVTAISVPVMVLANMLLSEPFFLAMLLLLLAALERFVAPAPPGEARPVWQAAALGFGVGLCMLVRTHGIVLVPAMVIALAVQRRWRDAAVAAAVAMACLLPWQLFSARYANVLPAPLLGAYDSYTAWWLRGLHEMGWGIVPRTLARTLPEAGEMFAALFSPLRGFAAHTATLVALGVLTVAGIASSWRRFPVTILFLGAYLVIVVLWPFQPGRFIWGVWPLLLILFALGARAALAGEMRWRVAVKALVLVSFCWVSVGYALYEVRAIRGRWWSSIPRAAANHITFAVGWTRANTAPGDIVSTEDEGPVYLYTGRRTIPVRTFTVDQYLGSTTPERDARAGLIPLLAAYPARAVLVSTTDAHNAARYLATQPNPRLALRGEYPAGAAFTVLPR